MKRVTTQNRAAATIMQFLRIIVVFTVLAGVMIAIIALRLAIWTPVLRH
jgi:hypothetical protein